MLTSANRMTVEILTGLVEKMRGPDFLTPSEIGRALNCLGLLGIMPVDRSRIAVRDPQPETTFGVFATATG